MIYLGDWLHIYRICEVVVHPSQYKTYDLYDISVLERNL